MGFKCGIIGLPNIGKSTLFNALTQSNIAKVANYPFCTIEHNLGKAEIKDQRLKKIAEISGSQKITYNQMEIVDIAGLVRGASNGEGLGNKFLSHIREVDAILHLLRCFTDDHISHVHNTIDPIADAEVVEMELIFADINSIEKRLPKLERLLKQNNDKETQKRVDLIREALTALKAGKPVRSLEHINKNEMKSLQLLTTKPVVYVCNVEDTNIITGNKLSKKVKKIAEINKSRFYYLSAKLEAEIANLENEEEKQKFLSEFGLQESGLNRITHIMYEVLNMITFFTIGPKEAHAWPLTVGSTADKAAGVIHTDFKRGFIKAETINFTDYIQYKSELACKEAGKIRFEGRDYIVQDGDIMRFKFNT